MTQSIKPGLSIGLADATTFTVLSFGLCTQLLCFPIKLENTQARRNRLLFIGELARQDLYVDVISIVRSRALPRLGDQRARAKSSSVSL